MSIGRRALLLVLVACASACSLRHATPKFNGYVVSVDGSDSAVTFTLMRQYPAYHGIGSCGDWVSYPSGYKPYKLKVPAAKGQFSDEQIEYSDADPKFGRTISDPKSYHATATIDEKGIEVTLINRDSGETYVHDRYQYQNQVDKDGVVDYTRFKPMVCPIHRAAMHIVTCPLSTDCLDRGITMKRRPPRPHFHTARYGC